MKYLFLVSIGPVQEFIASARRTRDLHFGSWFLSELSRSAAAAIHAHHGDLIFPAPENQEQLQPKNAFTVANRILALIELDPVDPAKQVRETIRKAVFQRLYEIRDLAYNKDISFLGERRELAYKQIDDLVEFLWVALPYHENTYHGTRRQLETLMAARKNVSAFHPVTWGEAVPKSSLDGQLESVIPENEYPPYDASPAVKRTLIERLYRRYGAGPAERLSGVDLLKRAGRTAFDSHFPSTSHIATLPFLQYMKQISPAGKSTLRTAWNTYVKTLDALAIIPLREQNIDNALTHPILGHSDGALLFEGRLADALGIPSTEPSLSEKLLQAKDALQVFYHSLDEQFKPANLSVTRPSSYYALLQADGDSMGVLIDALAEQGYEQHRAFSQALSHFAARVRTIVEDDHQGALVYSGGDDVFAFLPLHTVLACAIDLKNAFHTALSSIAKQFDRQPPTLSVGIAIVHHLESLRAARRLAHTAEQRAKQDGGRNALAITVSKRGGEDYHVVGKWNNIDVRLTQLITYCQEASIPTGMAYELRDLALRLSVPEDDAHYATLQEVLHLDTLRILLRKLTVPAGKVSPEKVKKIEAFLRVQLGLPAKEQDGAKSPVQQAVSPSPEKKPDAMVSIETFINELVIAQMLAEAEVMAHPGKGVKV